MFRRKAAMYPATHPVATSQRARPIVDTMIDPCFLLVCLFCASREDMRGCRGWDRPCFRGSVFGGDLSGLCAGSQCLRGSEREEGWSKEGDETGSIMDIGQCCWENDGIVPSTCRFHDFRGCNAGAWAVSVRRCLGLRVDSCYRTGVGPSWEGSFKVPGPRPSRTPNTSPTHPSSTIHHSATETEVMVSQFGSWRLHCSDNSWWPQGKRGKWKKGCQHGPLLFVQC